ncbi:hypothetical protein L1987_38805 [Smallanthus sonchifolius]|uniref:Uncharacterized protein n=1 Tax=Smallanthus sonchifolius TaxID=185202 RepID=A0ACB9HK87_9ASTR|nr:hypothetical protein L1987_38805 [Smallanthus sonchifolius]
MGNSSVGEPLTSTEDRPDLSPQISSTVHRHSVTLLLRPPSPSLCGLSSKTGLRNRTGNHSSAFKSIERMVMKLFGDEGGSEAGDISKIEINEEFARRFEHNKKREDLQRFEELKKKGVISDSEDDDESSDDDEDIVNYSTKHDVKFFDALIKVKNKDPSLKNNDAKLFDSDDELDVENEGAGDKKEKKTKPMFLKDANAKHLMENGPEFDDEDEEQNDKYRKKSYVEEQEAVRNEFLDAVADEDDDDGEFLKVKNDNNGDEDEDDREYEKKLDEYFKEDDKLDENEKFLKDFFRKKMWLEKDNGNGKVLHDDEIDVSEDEEELEKQEDYERGFNFRYEENAGDRVMGHSRKVEGSVRKKENARKIQRENKKERMAKAEFERNEELKYLKNLKKKEINEKLKKIRETAGIGESGGFLLEDHDLEEEFDPEEYDKKMKKAFDDSFYEADDVDPGFGSDDEDGELEKPNFDEEDELLGLPKGWDDKHGSGDGFLATREKTLKKKVKFEVGNEEQIQDEEEKRKISKLEEELVKNELEEYYKLECEDTIGDLRTRFRYKPVNKNTYGLKAKEVLLVDEKELNQLVPLKKLATYREDEFVVPRHKIKEHKQKIKSLLRGESSDGPTNGSKKSKHDVGQTETEKSKSDAENEDQKELSRKQRRKVRLNELKISTKRRMAYEGSTTKSNKKRKHKSKDAV